MGEVEVIRLVSWIAVVLSLWATVSAVRELTRVNGAYVLVRLIITIAVTATIGTLLFAISRQWFTDAAPGYGTARFFLLLAGTITLCLEPLFIKMALMEIRKQHEYEQRRREYAEEMSS